MMFLHGLMLHKMLDYLCDKDALQVMRCQRNMYYYESPRYNIKSQINIRSYDYILVTNQMQSISTIRPKLRNIQIKWMLYQRLMESELALVRFVKKLLIVYDRILIRKENKTIPKPLPNGLEKLTVSGPWNREPPSDLCYMYILFPTSLHTLKINNVHPLLVFHNETITSQLLDQLINLHVSFFTFAVRKCILERPCSQLRTLIADRSYIDIHLSFEPNFEFPAFHQNQQIPLRDTRLQKMKDDDRMMVEEYMYYGQCVIPEHIQVFRESNRIDMAMHYLKSTDLSLHIKGAQLLIHTDSHYDVLRDTLFDANLILPLFTNEQVLESLKITIGLWNIFYPNYHYCEYRKLHTDVYQQLEHVYLLPIIERVENLCKLDRKCLEKQSYLGMMFYVNTHLQSGCHLSCLDTGDFTNCTDYIITTYFFPLIHKRKYVCIN